MADVIDNSADLEEKIDSAQKALARMKMLEKLGEKAYFCWTCQTTTDRGSCWCDYTSDCYYED